MLSEQVCKPGPVLDNHLSRPIVANRLQPPPWDRRVSLMSLHGVAPGGVYRASLSPGCWWALTSPFHPCRRPESSRRSISVARSLKSPSPGITRRL